LSWNTKDIIQDRPCLSKQETEGYISKSISADKRFDIENHLLDCELCASAVEGFVQHPHEINESSRPAKKQNWFYLAAATLLLLISAYSFWGYESTNRSNAIFADYYQRPNWDVQTRGAIEDSQYANAIRLYNQQHFDAALASFNELIKVHSEDNRLRLYKGIAHLETGENTLAKEELQTVRINSEIFFEEATWYLALLKIKKNENSEARSLLDEVIENEEGFFYERALELKSGLTK